MYTMMTSVTATKRQICGYSINVLVVYFAGKKFREFHILEKIYTENKNLYGSHLIFDQFAKF